jgi:hypothetical protein
MGGRRFTSRGWWHWQLVKRPLRLIRRSADITTAAVGLYRYYFPERLNDEEQWNVWARDVETIQKHITDVFRHRKMFRDMTEMLQRNPALASDSDAGYWYQWLRNLYAHYITMAVRRELDRGADAPNLYRLLHAIKRRPEVVSRERYLRPSPGSSLSHDFRERLLNKTFDDLAGTTAYMDQQIVRDDLRQLDRVSKEAVEYANKIVAHRTEDEVQTTMEQVNRALELIEDILQKYYVLLTGRGLLGAEPSILINWQRAFRVPWIQS